MIRHLGLVGVAVAEFERPDEIAFDSATLSSGTIEIESNSMSFANPTLDAWYTYTY